MEISDFESEEQLVESMGVMLPETAADSRSAAEYHVQLLGPATTSSAELGFCPTPSSIAETSQMVATEEQMEATARLVVSTLQAAPRGEEQQAIDQAVTEAAGHTLMEVSTDDPVYQQVLQELQGQPGEEGVEDGSTSPRATALQGDSQNTTSTPSTESDWQEVRQPVFTSSLSRPVGGSGTGTRHPAAFPGSMGVEPHLPSRVAEGAGGGSPSTFGPGAGGVATTTVISSSVASTGVVRPPPPQLSRGVGPLTHPGRVEHRHGSAPTIALDTYVLRPGQAGVTSPGTLPWLARPSPVLPTVQRADPLRHLQVVQGHHAAGTQQERALTGAVQELAELQKEWDALLQRGHEIQQRQARLNVELGLGLVGLHTVFSHMSGALQ